MTLAVAISLTYPLLGMGILSKCSDDQGFAILGWLAPNVLYGRFEGVINDALGQRVMRRLAALVGDAQDVRYFCDPSRITTFDVKAYAAVIDVLLERREQFELIVAHTGVIPLSARTRSLTGAFRHFEIVTTDAEFEARLGAAVGELDIRDVTTLVDIEDGPFRDTWHVDANATLVAPAATGRAGERLSDSRGSVFLGWLDDGILYSRFERTITARLAARFAHRFSELVEERFGARYFSDSSAVVYYEPRAFAFISDAMRDNAAHFVRVTVRPRADIVATGKVSFPDALPGLEHIASEVEFSARLREATQPDGLLTLGSQQPASEREGEVLTPRTLARTAASAAATQVQETTARAADVHPALTRPLPSAGTLTYAFDLTHFEEGRLTAVRHPLPPSQSRDKWMCVARSDQHALAQAMVAAFVEWAVPRTRPPEQFTVRFSDAPSDPKPEQQS